MRYSAPFGAIAAASVLVLSALAPTVALASQAQAASDTAPEGEISLLAVVVAGSGSFEPGAAGDGLLTLSGVEHATWFSDRPVRTAGVYSIPQLAEVFFSEPDPPNAALTLLDGADEASDVIIVELSSPVYDASTRTLTFDAQVIDPDSERVDDVGLPALVEDADPAVPTTFGSGALFIDGADRCIVTDPPQQASGFDLSWNIKDLDRIDCATAAIVASVVGPDQCDAGREQPNSFQVTRAPRVSSDPFAPPPRTLGSWGCAYLERTRLAYLEFASGATFVVE